MLHGNASEWLVHFQNLEEQLAEAVSDVWPACVARLAPKKGALTHEDPITEQLVGALIRSKKLPGRLCLQYSLLTENPDGCAAITSYIDFVLTIGDDEDVYLACECKRLNVLYKGRRNSLASQYVKDGLARFIQGQYSGGLPLAVMIGYVMDSDLNFALSRLDSAVQKKKSCDGIKISFNFIAVAKPSLALYLKSYLRIWL